MENDLFQHFEKGVLRQKGQKIDLALCPWSPHKDFTGVSLKTLLAEEQTEGLLACHLVRIEPHCAIGLHRHPASIELHEVVSGQGLCLIGQEEVPYGPGTMAVIARDAPHEVRAGAEGLRLFAKFIALPK